MMNTRSRTHVSADATSRTAAPSDELMGIEFTENFNTNCFRRLKNREIQSTKWACPTILNQLGLTNDFNLLCNRVGLLPFVFQDTPTYRRLTLEFLSTLKHTVGIYYRTEEEYEGSDIITFRLINQEYNMTLTEWCNTFGFVNNNSYIRCTTYMLNPTPTQYFNRMSISSLIPKGNLLEYPAVRYLCYVIANTLQARGEITRVNEEDMAVLAKAVVPNCNVTPNLGAILVLYLEHQALQGRGPIACGGVITVLANSLHIH